MSRLGFHLLHTFWWLFSPTYRANWAHLQDTTRHLATVGTTATLTGGQQLVNVHPTALCQGNPCAIHNPSSHHMNTWRQHFRQDRYLTERICPHGIGHPDPDHVTYLKRTANPDKTRAATIHGCDGCCKPPNPQRDKTSQPRPSSS